MNLDAVSLKHKDKKIVVSSDAKRRELFVAAYDQAQRVFGPAVLKPEELDQFVGYQPIKGKCNAELIGRFALFAIENQIELS
ncbi:hypothetical protein LW977_17975, partial [Erwinia amylovora]|uniref:hypothetical protein n=1 Tax=Erwinia amylovora TaxID=552 RepID=UPI0020BFA6CE